MIERKQHITKRRRSVVKAAGANVLRKLDAVKGCSQSECSDP
jgi:hypothetical protein